MNKTECQAKDPSTCRYHGTKIAMENAIKNQDFDGYYKARKKLETLKPEKTVEINDEGDTVVPLNLKRFVNPFTAKKFKVLAENAMPVDDFVESETTEALGLKRTDIVSFGSAKTWGYTHLARKVYKKTDTGWDEIGTGVYDEYKIKNILKKKPHFTKEQARNHACLVHIVEDQVKNSYRV